jgi:hypothetical protein
MALLLFGILLMLPLLINLSPLLLLLLLFPPLPALRSTPSTQDGMSRIHASRRVLYQPLPLPSN